MVNFNNIFSKTQQVNRKAHEMTPAANGIASTPLGSLLSREINKESAVKRRGESDRTLDQKEHAFDKFVRLDMFSEC